MTRVLIAGGYGVVGSQIARCLRAAHPDLDLLLAGRNPLNGAILAAELGARTARCDVSDAQTGLAEIGPVDLVIAALRDPGDNLMLAASRAGAAFTSIAGTENLSALAIAFRLGRRPALVLSYWMAGALTLAALAAARAFAKVERIELAALYDSADPIGPMTVADSGGFSGGALIRRGRDWARLEPSANARTVARGEQAPAFEARPVTVLDVPGLAAATLAPDIRFDLGFAPSLGTLSQRAPSHDLYIDLSGSDAAGKALCQRTIVSDPKGQARLTALGVLIGAERLLGLDGKAPPPAGIAFPEEAIEPEFAARRLRDFGVSIETVAMPLS
ncbi:MAG TPA: hypothetical protein VGS12_13985 [Caulobacteraceae bacterium]|nr:hypothetical protein [Caulobacteraceae bacterium]